MSVRKWHVDQALHSTRSLMVVLPELTLKEILAALKLESETRRRKNILRRLIGRAARLNELEYVRQLEERYYNGPRKQRDPVPGGQKSRSR